MGDNRTPRRGGLSDSGGRSKPASLSTGPEPIGESLHGHVDRTVRSMVGVRTVLEDEPPDGDVYTVVVAVANPDTVDQLMRTAVDLAAAHHGEVLAVGVVHKPLSSTFLMFSGERIREEYQDERALVLERATIFGSGTSVPVRRHLLVGSDVSAAIRKATRSGDGDALLLGWQDRAHPSDIVLGKTVDRVIARAPCPTYVERVGTTADGLDSILLPTVGGPHLEAASDLAEAVARANDATVTVASFLSRDDERARADATEHVATAVDALDGVSCDRVLEPCDDVAASIEAAAGDHDLVVLGATRERGLRRRIVGSVARRVAGGAAPPVVIAKRGASRTVIDRVLGR